MNAQFKPQNFNIESLKSFVQQINDQGITIVTQWKNGKEIIAIPNGNTTFLEIKYNDKLLFKQLATAGNKGLVNLDELNEKDKLFILKLLKTNGFYTQPTWTLGIVLSSIYVALVSLVAFANSGIIGVILAVLMIMTVAFMVVLYNWSVNKISNKTLKWFYVLGLGYLLTSPSSLLNIVLFIQTSYNKLYFEIEKIN